MNGLVCDYCGKAAPIGAGVAGWLVLGRIQQPSEDPLAAMGLPPGLLRIITPPPAMPDLPAPPKLPLDEGGVHFDTGDCVVGWLRNGMRPMVEGAALG